MNDDFEDLKSKLGVEDGVVLIQVRPEKHRRSSSSPKPTCWAGKDHGYSQRGRSPSSSLSFLSKPSAGEAHSQWERPLAYSAHTFEVHLSHIHTPGMCLTKFLWTPYGPSKFTHPRTHTLENLK